MTKSGLSIPPVLGPVLDGAGPFALISDTDNGSYDGDKRYDRAIGPMQFLPETWGTVASDGNGDGKKDVQNIWDAALGAANYFCRGETRLGTPKGLAANIFRYNRSQSYVKLVLGIMREYGAKVKIVPTEEAPKLKAKKKSTKKKVVRKPVVVPTQSPEPTPTPTKTVPGPGTEPEDPSGPRVP
jgi:membrane-bound lytic murein transglycosylase B